MRDMRTRILYVSFAALAGLLTLPLWVNSCLHLRSDAFHHVAIVHSIARHGIPLMNPFVAGDSLNYYWFYNAVIAVLARISRLDPLPLMISLNGVLLFLFLVAHAFVQRTIQIPRKGMFTAFILLLCGLNGWGWVFYLGGILRKWHAFSDLFQGTVAEILWSFVYQYTGKVAFSSSKFLVVNAFPASLVSLLFGLGYLVKAIRHPSWKHSILFLVFGILSCLLNLIVGAAFLGAVAIALAVAYSVDLIRKRQIPQRDSASPSSDRSRSPLLRGGFRHVAGIAAAAILFLFLVMYVRSSIPNMSAGVSSVHIAFPGKDQVWALAVVLLPLWVVYIATGLRRRSLAREEVILHLLVLALSVEYLFLRLRGGNEYKILFLIVIPLSLILAGRFHSLTPRRSILATIFLVSIVPPTVLGTIGYCFARCEEPISPAKENVCRWLRENTPRDAVVLTQDPVMTAYVPVLGARDVLLADESWLKQRIVGLPANIDETIGERSLLLNRLFRSGDHSVMEEISREMNRPIILLTSGRQIDFSSAVHLQTIGEIDIWRPFNGAR